MHFEKVVVVEREERKTEDDNNYAHSSLRPCLWNIVAANILIKDHVGCAQPGIGSGDCLNSPVSFSLGKLSTVIVVGSFTST